MPFCRDTYGLAVSALANITTAFDAKDHLVTLIAGLSEVESGSVYYGHPGTTVPDFNEWIWVGEIEWDEGDDPQSLGGRHSVEIYRMFVTIESHVPDDNQYDANQRVKAKGQALQTALVASANPLSIVPNPTSTRLEPQFLGEGNNGTAGRGAIFVLSLRVEVRKQ
jgi:hypothetical protein